MFDERMLQEIIQEQCKNDKVVFAGVWALGPNVFVSRVKELGSGDWLFLFYYDSSYATFRDLASISSKTRELLVCLMSDTVHAAGGFPVERFHFAGRGIASCPVGDELVDAFNVAKLVLVGTSGNKIDWLPVPKEVPILF